MINPPSLYLTLDDPGPAAFYADDFRSMLEDHLPNLIASNDTNVVTIDPATANKFDGDFIGLLQSQNVAPYLHWLTVRMNGFTNPSQYSVTNTSILVPGQALLNQLLSVYLSVFAVS